ncbi:hypothetical protein DER44DRAFT_853830 [Fusarium oxysporum]|nr:hypothetical protein DER44DRAFT_853830 [Fusarium oxysporum]
MVGYQKLPSYARFSRGLIIAIALLSTATQLLSAVGLWSLPKSEPLGFRNTFGDLISRVDWIGALLASASMASLSYFLAVISTDVHRIKETGTIILLCFSLATLPLFVALSFAVLNSLDLLTSLYFQEIQYLSAVEAAIRILPSTVVGLGLNLMTGLIVHKIPAVWLVAVSSLLSSGSPLLMAMIDPNWSYWVGAFFAQTLLPFSIDVLFTVGLIIVTEVFPEKNQSVAGAVFNTAAQFGNALGLAIVQVVSAGVTNRNINPKSPEARLEGYRASFWTLFALMLVCVLVGALGLRKAGPRFYGVCSECECDEMRYGHELIMAIRLPNKTLSGDKEYMQFNQTSHYLRHLQTPP